MKSKAININRKGAKIMQRVLSYLTNKYISLRPSRSCLSIFAVNINFNLQNARYYFLLKKVLKPPQFSYISTYTFNQ